MSRIEATLMPSVPQVSSILASLGQAAFVWDLAADTIAWSDNAGAVFTDSGHMIHIIRKVMVRIGAKVDWLILKLH